MSQPSNAFCRQGYLNGPSLRLHKIFGSVLFAGRAATLFGPLNLKMKALPYFETSVFTCQYDVTTKTT